MLVFISFTWGEKRESHLGLEEAYPPPQKVQALPGNLPEDFR